jgi:glutaredoxin
MRKISFVLALVLMVGACKGRSPADIHGEGGVVVPEGPAVPFEVRTDSTDLVLFWFDEHGAGHATSRVQDVPEERRNVVRVDPPRPDQRAPGWIYLTDLRTPSPTGTFPVRPVRADDLSRQLLAMGGHQGSMGTPPAQPVQPTQPQQPGGVQGSNNQPTTAGVIVYGASWCSACHQAAGWFRAHNVPFVEKDIEQDPGAQQEMLAKAQRAGVPTGSIPILDVRGHILLGFSPPAIERALAGT